MRPCYYVKTVQARDGDFLWFHMCKALVKSENGLIITANGFTRSPVPAPPKSCSTISSGQKQVLKMFANQCKITLQRQRVETRLKERKSRKPEQSGAERSSPRTPAARGEHVPPAAGRAALPEPPPGAQGLAWPHPPDSFILNPGLPYLCACARAERRIRDREAVSGHSLRPESGPGCDSRVPAASFRGWSERSRRPAPETRTSQPHPPSGLGPSFPRSYGAACKPSVPAAGLPFRGRKSPQRPLPSARLPPRRRGQTLSVLLRASQRGQRAGGREGTRRPSHREDKGRAGSRRPAWEVTLIILRGSPAILSDPKFGLWSRLRLRSPHARVEVPGSTSGGRCRTRRCRRHRLQRGPLGNVVPAPARAGVPRTWSRHPHSPPHPRPGGGGSDAQRRGRDSLEAARGGAGLRRSGAILPHRVGTGQPALCRPLIGGHARACGNVTEARPPTWTTFVRSFVCSSYVLALRAAGAGAAVNDCGVVDPLAPSSKGGENQNSVSKVPPRCGSRMLSRTTLAREF